MVNAFATGQLKRLPPTHIEEYNVVRKDLEDVRKVVEACNNNVRDVVESIHESNRNVMRAIHTLCY